MLKQAELGTPAEEVYRKPGVSDTSFYNWNKKHGELGSSELGWSRQLEEENGKLKRLVADLSLDRRCCGMCRQKGSEACPQAHPDR